MRHIKLPLHMKTESFDPPLSVEGFLNKDKRRFVLRFAFSAYIHRIRKTLAHMGLALVIFRFGIDRKRLQTFIKINSLFVKDPFHALPLIVQRNLDGSFRLMVIESIAPTFNHTRGVSRYWESVSHKPPKKHPHIPLDRSPGQISP